MRKSLGKLASKERDLVRILSFSQDLKKYMDKLYNDEEWFRHYHYSSNITATKNIRESSKHLEKFQQQIISELKDLDKEISDLYFEIYGKKIDKLTNE